MDKFKALAADYIDTTVALTEQRLKQRHAEKAADDSKKNSV